MNKIISPPLAIYKAEKQHVNYLLQKLFSTLAST